MDPAGRRLKIPIWMLLPECAEITISQRPRLGKQALLSLASLIISQLDSKDPAHDNLRQTHVRAFDEKVESIVDSHEIRFNIHTGTKGPVMNGEARERVVAAIEAGHTRVKVAGLYNMALSTVGGFIKRKRETGSVSPEKFGGHKTFALEPHTALVKELVAEQPDSTLAELQVRLAKEKVKVSQSGISRFLHHINLTFRKKHTRGGA